VTVSLSAARISVVVLDIEGTTTPAAFVYDVLFPYAREHVAEHLAREQNSDKCRQAIALLHEEQTADGHSGDLAAYVHWLMDRDRKSPALKMLQGLIWEAGYRSGALKGRVYPDVPPAFERWRAHDRRIYIYSSGSVLAQQLLFATTQAGDLTTRLSGYFDTAVGPKTSPESYRVIIDRIGVPPLQALFVSDVVAELDAALEVGLRTALCVRAAGSRVAAHSHPLIHTFDDVVD
jgi:enolase-phosphatase E1